MFITCGPNGVKLEDFDMFFSLAGGVSHVEQKGKSLRKTDILRMWINRRRTGGLTYIHVLVVILYFIDIIYDPYPIFDSHPYIYIYMIIYVYIYICFEISDMSLTMFF